MDACDQSVYRRIDDLKLIIGEVNQSPSLVDQKNISFKRFAGLAGQDGVIPNFDHCTDNILKGDWPNIDSEGTIDVLAFRADMTQRGFDSLWADAAFKAFDVTENGRINKYEYFLGILVATKSHELDCFVDQKWIIFRSKLLFSFFCRSDGTMTRAELEELSHECLTPIDIACVIPVGSEHSWQCTQREFIKFVLDCDIDVVLALNVCGERRPRPRNATKRVTLDSRLITTENTAMTLKTHVSTTMPTLGKAPGLIVETDLAPTYDWPQYIIYDRTCVVHKIANFVLQQTIGLVHLQLTSEAVDSPSDIWLRSRDILCTLLGTKDKERQASYIHKLSEGARHIFSAQPTVVSVDAPCKIFGDIHGQFRDMLLLFARYGFPSHRGGDIELSSYVFNGDWVDRGTHQLETVILLFALKILYPTRVFLVRGNHEFRQQNKNMSRSGAQGFDKACWKAFKCILGNIVFRCVHAAFDMLPLVAVVDKSVAVMHGGLGDGQWTLDDARAIQRPLVSELENEIVFNMVWSDPIPELSMDPRKGAHTSERDNFKGKIKRFAMDITQQWCARENISLVVRSHEYNPSGFLVMHGGRLITVFSARNYMDTHLNDSALLLLTHDDTGALRVRIKILSKRTNMPDEAVAEQFGTLKAGSPLLDAIEVKPLATQPEDSDSNIGVGDEDVDGSDHSGVVIAYNAKPLSKTAPPVKSRSRSEGFVAMMRKKVTFGFPWKMATS